MTTHTFIPGYMTDIQLDAQNVTLIGQVVSFSDDQTAVPKPTFGTKYRRTIGGQGVYAIDISGHLAAEEVGALWALRATVGTVDWLVQIGDIATPTDGGIINGAAIVTNFTMDADAEGNWAWSMTLEGDGTPAFTPPV